MINLIPPKPSTAIIAPSNVLASVDVVTNATSYFFYVERSNIVSTYYSPSNSVTITLGSEDKILAVQVSDDTTWTWTDFGNIPDSTLTNISLSAWVPPMKSPWLEVSTNLIQWQPLYKMTNSTTNPLVQIPIGNWSTNTFYRLNGVSNIISTQREFDNPRPYFSEGYFH